LLFILGLIIEFFRPKEEVKDQDLPDNVKGLKDIGSNSVIQKIDLATAYMSMGKRNLAKKIIQRLENNSLTKFEKNELSKLKKQIDND
jgi:Tfp pilus assembly protein FimV